jgi:hypothetical protein
MSAVAAFFGFGVAQKLDAKEHYTDGHPIYGKQGEWLLYKQYPKKKGLIVFTINVGQLSPQKAEAFIDRMKERFIKEDTRKTFDEWEFIFMPVRVQDTKVEFISYDQNAQLEAQELLRDETEFIAPDKAKVKDYALLMLGAPVVKIELDEQQLDMCYEMTNELFKRLAQSKGAIALNCEGLGDEIFKQMTYARAMIMLGHVRRKLRNVPEQAWGLDDARIAQGIQLDGNELVSEGMDLLDRCMENLSSL